MTKLKKKLRLDLAKFGSKDIQSDGEEVDSLASDVDEDEELQKAFARGELQPGLNAVVPIVKKEFVNNVSGLKAKLKQIMPNWQWSERLDIVTEPAPLSKEAEQQFGDLTLKINRKGFISEEEKDDKAQHDFKREIIFYQQAKAAVLKAIPRLHKLKVPTKVPDDYIAEMLKSDGQMKKIENRIVARKEAIERSEKAKKLRELKKMGKKIQVEVLQKRQMEKKEMLNQVKKFREGKGTLDFLNDSKDVKKGKGRGKGQQERAHKEKPKSKNPTKKSSYKNERYGYGGKKKRGKYNDKESAADMSSFGGRKRSKGGPKASAGGKKQRPGKQRRQQIKKKR